MHQRDGQLGKIGNVVVEKLGRLVHATVEASVADFGDVCVVRARDELLQVREPRRFSERVDQLGLDVGVPGFLSGHLKQSLVFYQGLSLRIFDKLFAFSKSNPNGPAP